MTEVRCLAYTGDSRNGNSSGLCATNRASTESIHHDQQKGLFATTMYNEGDVILTESPIAILSPLVANLLEDSVASTASMRKTIRAQFRSTSYSSTANHAKNAMESNDEEVMEKPLTIFHDLMIPPSIMKKVKSCFPHFGEALIRKIRGLLLAAATYTAYLLLDHSGTHTKSWNNEQKKKLFELFHPSLESNASTEYDEETKKLMALARIVVECCKELVAPGSAMYTLLNENKESSKGEDELLRIILIYSCNAFEGGRIYDQLSRVNHSCNPNAVVVEGDSPDTSVLRAACLIKLGDEITVSYLGWALYAGYPTRQRKLTLEKHFLCNCSRCHRDSYTEAMCDTPLSGDTASRIPCPICHPRDGRYLDENIMFDESEDNLHVSYAIPGNGMNADDRHLNCPKCGIITSIFHSEPVRKQYYDAIIKNMCLVEEKVFDRIECNNFNKVDEARLYDYDMDRSLFQMALSICGSKHWTSHILNLNLIEDSLASIQSTFLSLGNNREESTDTMHDMFTDIAECADGIEKVFSFAHSLHLNLDPAHWLFDYTLGLARALVGLGDEKSQKYGADWISRVESYAEKFESDGMKKVVSGIKNAYKRETSEAVLQDRTGNIVIQGDKTLNEKKRRKIGK